jgi:hypothetical protein
MNKPYYFGITLAYNTSNYYVHRAREFVTSDSISSIVSPRGPGFNLGIITNLKLGQFFDVRFLPTLSFADRRLQYMENGRVVDKRIEAVFLEAPFQIRYKSAPYRDVRAFVLAGVKYNFDLAGNSRTRQVSNLVKVSTHDFLLEWGFGFQVYFPYFIFSPEIKFSYGLNNSLFYDRDLIYSTLLEKVYARCITISFNFEG